MKKIKINWNHGEQVKTCLVNDNRLLYKTNSSISHICDEDYKIKTNEKSR